MKAIYEWEELLKAICKEKGWEENKNCRIKCEAQADTKKDILNLIARIYPFDSLEEITIRVVLE